MYGRGRFERHVRVFQPSAWCDSGQGYVFSFDLRIYVLRLIAGEFSMEYKVNGPVAPSPLA